MAGKPSVQQKKQQKVVLKPISASVAKINDMKIAIRGGVELAQFI